MDQLAISLSQIKYTEVFLSGLIIKVLKSYLIKLFTLRKTSTRITTGKLNRWLSTIIENNHHHYIKENK